ncbi:hypothetical protein N9368_02990 [Alphaproteobacteria bacterium]|nr:hypothetical protein [Alphaproteobacteria bacterium]
MNTVLLGIIATLTLPLSFANRLAGIVGLFWLVFLGDWLTLLVAILAHFSVFILSPPLLLAFVFAIPGMALLKYGKLGKWLASPFLILATSVTWIVMSAWGFLVFHEALERATDSMWPYLLCAYSISTGPWAYMASRGGENKYVTIPLFFNQWGALWMVLSVGFSLTRVTDAVLIYFGIMGVGFVLSLALGLLVIDEYEV